MQVYTFVNVSDDEVSRIGRKQQFSSSVNRELPGKGGLR